jgi:CubicO group peptidase (beta-lactamase class C family)
MNELLGDIDAFCDAALSDWNVPGLAVGVVKDGEMAFAKGYGFRDFTGNLPFTPNTKFPIASNTKLFTAIAAGMLVEEGLLDWDRPIRETVPSVRFSSDALNNTVSLRDMLAHRTGINRHDSMWYLSTFSRKDMFDRLRFMQASDPLRQNFVYNNVMYAAVGHIIELLTEKTWESFVQERILARVGMINTCFSTAEAYRSGDYAVPHTERRDSKELFKLPMYEHMIGAGPAGGMHSNLHDMGRWLGVLIAGGKLGDEQIVSPSILQATLAPSMAIPNHMLNVRGFTELLNSTYGLGRHTGAYRGHLMAFHGGSLGGFYSQVSYLPQQNLGVVTFVIGHHCAVLADFLTYNVYERFLGLNQTPWSERFLEIMDKYKAAMTVARSKAARNHVDGTHPSHNLDDFVGTFENALYPLLKITLQSKSLSLAFRDSDLALTHVHYDRFDTEDDEVYGKWSVNFSTDPQGEISSLTMTLDEAEAVFKRLPEPVDAAVVAKLIGAYATPSGFKCQVVQKDGGQLFLDVPGELSRPLQLYRSFEFRSPAVSNMVYRFEVESGVVTGLTLVYPGGESALKRV